MPIDPQTGERLPYPGEPGAPPETLDGPESDMPQLGVTLEPAQMAAMAMQAIAQMAEMEQAALDELLMQAKMRFTAEQQAALAQVPDAIAAIMAQMQGPPPETLDGPASTLPVEPDEMAAPV